MDVSSALPDWLVPTFSLLKCAQNGTSPRSDSSSGYMARFTIPSTTSTRPVLSSSRALASPICHCFPSRSFARELTENRESHSRPSIGPLKRTFDYFEAASTKLPYVRILWRTTVLRKQKRREIKPRTVRVDMDIFHILLKTEPGPPNIVWLRSADPSKCSNE